MRFEAFKGFSLPFPFDVLAFAWVAILQVPIRHLIAGSGKLWQYCPVGNSTIFSQPSHCSTMVWQLPPLNWHPFLVIKKQSVPSLIVIQTMVITSFLWEFLKKSVFMPEPTPVVKRNISQKMSRKETVGWIFRDNRALGQCCDCNFNLSCSLNQLHAVRF